MSGRTPRCGPAPQHTGRGRLNRQTLFGSDYPFISLDRWFEEFDQLGLSEEAKQGILVGNATKLLQL